MSADPAAARRDGSVLTVLGIDPGTASTGYGVVRRTGSDPALVECGVLRTDAGAPLADRLRTIFEGVQEVLGRHAPDAVAVEGVFYARNVRTTVVLGHARGVALLAASLRDLPVHAYSPRQVKNAVVGAGGATKAQVQFMVQQLLRLKSPPKPADAADAVAVALCHCYADRLLGVARAAGVEGDAVRGRVPRRTDAAGRRKATGEPDGGRRP